METCASDNIKCIVIDNNGYIVLSKDSEEVGTFFGEGYGAILEILLERNIFQNTTIYDFQAMCKNEKDESQTSDAESLLTVCPPVDRISWILNFSIVFPASKCVGECSQVRFHAVDVLPVEIQLVGECRIHFPGAVAMSVGLSWVN